MLRNLAAAFLGMTIAAPVFAVTLTIQPGSSVTLTPDQPTTVQCAGTSASTSQINSCSCYWNDYFYQVRLTVLDAQSGQVLWSKYLTDSVIQTEDACLQEERANPACR